MKLKQDKSGAMSGWYDSKGNCKYCKINFRCCKCDPIFLWYQNFKILQKMRKMRIDNLNHD
tara:strand:+ start:3855 stop:4037 length:183 start_codon:yes stop_codon:yes gene_type:complete